jgi:membrane associated rhomboid family serine protease
VYKTVRRRALRHRPHLDLDHLPTPTLNALTAVLVAVWMGWIACFVNGDAAIQGMTDQFTLSLGGLRAGRFWTILTSELSHASLLHLAFNVVVLRSFGADIERVIGGRAFLHLFVAGALAASAGHLAYVAATGVDVPALGASGAAMAILVASASIYPHRWVLLFFVIPLPVRVAVAIALGIDLFGLVSPGGDLIAHGAHLGGAAYGFFYARTQAKDDIRERLAALGYALR